MQTSTRRRKRGFVLVLVLTMLILTVFTMSRLAVHGIRNAQVAASAERSMRSRWRHLSLQRLAFSRAPELMRGIDHRTSVNASEGSSSAPQFVSFVDVTAEMTGQSYRIRISDESAKLPIGALLAKFKVNRVLNAAEQLLPPGYRFRLIGESQVTTGFHDLNQLVENTGHPSKTPAAIAYAAGTRLTLWGPNKLGLKRTDPATIDVLWRVLFQRPAPSQLHRLRQTAGNQGDLLAQLALRETELNLARQWMSSDSDHYSVWITPQPAGWEPESFFVRWGSGLRPSYRVIEY